MFTLQTSLKPLLLGGGGESVSRGDSEKQGGKFLTFVQSTSKNSASGGEEGMLTAGVGVGGVGVKMVSPECAECA